MKVGDYVVISARDGRDSSPADNRRGHVVAIYDAPCRPAVTVAEASGTEWTVDPKYVQKLP